MNTVLPRNFQPHVIVFSMTSYLLIFILFHLYLLVVNSINAQVKQYFSENAIFSSQETFSAGFWLSLCKAMGSRLLGGSIQKSYYRKLLLILFSWIFYSLPPPPIFSTYIFHLTVALYIFHFSLQFVNFFFTWISFRPNL